MYLSPVSGKLPFRLKTAFSIDEKYKILERFNRDLGRFREIKVTTAYKTTIQSQFFSGTVMMRKEFC